MREEIVERLGLRDAAVVVRGIVGYKILSAQIVIEGALLRPA